MIMDDHLGSSAQQLEELELEEQLVKIKIKKLQLQRQINGPNHLLASVTEYDQSHTPFAPQDDSFHMLTDPTATGDAALLPFMAQSNFVEPQTNWMEDMVSCLGMMQPTYAQNDSLEMDPTTLNGADASVWTLGQDYSAYTEPVYNPTPWDSIYGTPGNVISDETSAYPWNGVPPVSTYLDDSRTVSEFGLTRSAQRALRTALDVEYDTAGIVSPDQSTSFECSTMEERHSSIVCKTMSSDAINFRPPMRARNPPDHKCSNETSMKIDSRNPAAQSSIPSSRKRSANGDSKIQNQPLDRPGYSCFSLGPDTKPAKRSKRNVCSSRALFRASKSVKRCLRCTLFKIKCDGQMPCGHCMKASFGGAMSVKGLSLTACLTRFQDLIPLESLLVRHEITSEEFHSGLESTIASFMSLFQDPARALQTYPIGSTPRWLKWLIALYIGWSSPGNPTKALHTLRKEMPTQPHGERNSVQTQYMSYETEDCVYDWLNIIWLDRICFSAIEETRRSPTLIFISHRLMGNVLSELLPNGHPLPNGHLISRNLSHFSALMQNRTPWDSAELTLGEAMKRAMIVYAAVRCRPDHNSLPLTELDVMLHHDAVGASWTTIRSTLIRYQTGAVFTTTDLPILREMDVTSFRARLEHRLIENAGNASFRSESIPSLVAQDDHQTGSSSRGYSSTGVDSLSINIMQVFKDPPGAWNDFDDFWGIWNSDSDSEYSDTNTSDFQWSDDDGDMPE